MLTTMNALATSMMVAPVETVAIDQFRMKSFSDLFHCCLGYWHPRMEAEGEQIAME